MEEDKGKLELIAFKTFHANQELVYVIDFLNKSLKEKKIMFGLTKDKETETMTVNIYEF
ncbi:MAG TPA: YpmA family protein [Syntrophomonadaceae bacterium]|nr:YpmA family protein [Syntrophomonadaceae bacterium]